MLSKRFNAREKEVSIMRGNCSALRGVVIEIRDLLKEINQKLCHLIEQNRADRMMFFRNKEEE